MDRTVILGIKLAHRTNTSTLFQEVITRHGCNIKTRIGLHQVSENKCSPDGVILLEILGEDDEVESLENEIRAIPHAEVQKMVFNTAV